ncbi:hypothetical protein EDB83DRAFT_2426095 [Lactarius deliciosus]|nr:hypothetical protein EDB83DRAFT_2426095 [Lactarius deliciosus]
MHSHAGSRVGFVLSLRHARLASIHFSLCALFLLPAGPLFTRLGSGHRQYRPRDATRGHPYGFGRWGHLEAQVVIYWNWESDFKGTIRPPIGMNEWVDVARGLFACHDSGSHSPISYPLYTHTPSLIISLVTSHCHGAPPLIFAPNTAPKALVDKPRVHAPPVKTLRIRPKFRNHDRWPRRKSCASCERTYGFR